MVVGYGCSDHKKVILDEDHTILPGAYQTGAYLDVIRDKKVGLVVNHTSRIDETHLVDSLLALGVDVKMIFAPEHGFKGTAYNGEEIKDDLYKGEIPIRSIYGRSKKPSKEDMAKVDVLIFDIQDVGARFYTYISTLHYVMEAVAESDKKLIILDRPNPNAHYIDGPMMESEHTSFIGMHPVPVVYGMTIGEYGRMINGEGWLADHAKCKLMVVKNKHYAHDRYYELPISPSPNLPNQLSILLYPSLCFLEGTVVNEGRGTDLPFQQYGHPLLAKDYTYTPTSRSSSRYPRCQDQLCGGVDLSKLDAVALHGEGQIDLTYLVDTYHDLSSKLGDAYFLESGFFEKLAGTDELRAQLKSGIAIQEIRASWREDIEAFKKVRSKYLLY